MGSIHSLRSVLSSCSRTLENFSLNHFPKGDDQELMNLETISMSVLRDLSLSTQRIHQYPQTVPILSIIAPNLKSLICRYSQLPNIEACSLESLGLHSEDESVEDWEEERDEEFSQQLKNGLSWKLNLKTVKIYGHVTETQDQTQSNHFLSAIQCTDGEQPLCPNLERLWIFQAGKIDSVEILASLAISVGRDTL